MKREYEEFFTQVRNYPGSLDHLMDQFVWSVALWMQEDVGEEASTQSLRAEWYEEIFWENFRYRLRGWCNFIPSSLSQEERDELVVQNAKVLYHLLPKV